MLIKNTNKQNLLKIVLILIIIYLVFKDLIMENYTIREVYQKLKEYLPEKQAKLMILHILHETGIRSLDVKIKNKKIDYMSDQSFENVKNNNLLNMLDYKTLKFAKFATLKNFIEYALSIYIGDYYKKKYKKMLEDATKYDKEQMIATFCADLVYYKFCIGKDCTYNSLYASFTTLYNQFWNKL